MGAQCCYRNSGPIPNTGDCEVLPHSALLAATQERDEFCEEVTANAVTLFTSHNPLPAGRAKRKLPAALTSRRDSRSGSPKASADAMNSEKTKDSGKVEGWEERKRLSVAGSPHGTFKTDSDKAVNRSGMMVSIDLSGFRRERKESVDTSYELMYVLGKGSFGEVRKVRDKETKECRAMKVISKANCKTTVNYREEVDILKQLVLQQT